MQAEQSVNYGLLPLEVVRLSMVTTKEEAWLCRVSKDVAVRRGGVNDSNPTVKMVVVGVDYRI